MAASSPSVDEIDEPLDVSDSELDAGDGDGDSPSRVDADDVVSKIGCLDVKKDGEKKLRNYFFMLTGSTLYMYKSIKDKDPKSNIQLKGAEVTESSTPTPTSLIVKVGGKVVLIASASTEEERAEWLKPLRDAVHKEAREPPEKSKSNKGKLTFRMKKALAGKVAVSAAGKFVANKSVPQEVQDLLNSLRKLLSASVGEKSALMVEDNIIKLWVKCYFLLENNVLTNDDLLYLDPPLREAFSKIIKVREATYSPNHGISGEVIDKHLRLIREELLKIESGLSKLLSPHLKAQSVQRVHQIFGIIGTVDFLRTAIVQPAPPQDVGFLKDEIDDLVAMMEKYLAFQYYRGEN